MTDYVSLQDVTKTYRMGEITIKAADGISFDVQKGEFVIVVGPSGAGKTTVLNILGGMDVATSGKVFVDGAEITKYRGKKLIQYRREEIGFVFQFYNLMQNLTALENVELAMQICKYPLDAKKVLEEVGLKERMNNFPAQLSGGQKQRVAMARMLAAEPELLLLDEPFAALDSYLKWKMEQQMMDLLKDIQKPALFVSHSRDEVYRLCDTVSCINQGKMEVIEPVKEFFKNPKTKTAALLSGCKNICSVELVKDLEPTKTQMKDTSSGKLWAAEWGVAFDVSKEAFTARTVGIRAHYMMQKKPKAGHITELTVGEYRILEDPFEWNISFRPSKESGWLQWKISKSDWNPSAGVPKVLYVREEDLLLLDKE